MLEWPPYGDSQMTVQVAGDLEVGCLASVRKGCCLQAKREWTDELREIIGSGHTQQLHFL